MDKTKIFQGIQNREIVTDELSVRILGTDEGGDEEGRSDT